MFARRNLLGLTVGLLAVPALPASAVGTYSQGWRMGMLTKFSVKGIFRKTGEGELLLGNESGRLTRMVGTGDNRREEILNPWAFSCDAALFERYRNLGGRTVAVRYRQETLNNPLAGDTSYRVEEMFPISPELRPDGGCELPGEHSARSDGFRVGRIVKATSKGLVNDSWEMQMQVGASGNEFHEMSISDAGMFACATAHLRAGRMVTVNYSQTLFRNPLARNTTYEVVGIVAAGL